ncbi:MAG: L,D-transpeptidase Cds6 family protein [Gammaproteobacteria bacterium]
MLEEIRLTDKSGKSELVRVNNVLTKLGKELQQERLTNQTLSQNVAQLMASQHAQEQHIVTITQAHQSEQKTSQSRIDTLSLELNGEQETRGEMRAEFDSLTEAYRAQGKALEEMKLTDESGKSELVRVNNAITKLGKELQQERLTNQALSQNVTQLMASQQAQEQQVENLKEAHQAELKIFQTSIATLVEEQNGERLAKRELRTEFDRLTKMYTTQSQQIEEFKLVEAKGKIEMLTLRNQLASLAEDLEQEQLVKQDLSKDVVRLSESQKVYEQSSKADLLSLSNLKRKLADSQLAWNESEQKLAKLRLSYQEQVQVIATNRSDKDIVPRTHANNSIQKSFSGSDVSDQQLQESDARQNYASVQQTTNKEEVLVSSTDPVFETLIHDWAKAWSQQDVNEYLSYYADDYRPASGASHDAWRKTRKNRITRPTFVDVKISNVSIKVLDTNQAVVTFQQGYRADHYQDEVNKTFNLKRSQDKWRIVREIVHKN